MDNGVGRDKAGWLERIVLTVLCYFLAPTGSNKDVPVSCTFRTCYSHVMPQTSPLLTWTEHIFSTVSPLSQMPKNCLWLYSSKRRIYQHDILLLFTGNSRHTSPPSPLTDVTVICGSLKLRINRTSATRPKRSVQFAMKLTSQPMRADTCTDASVCFPHCADFSCVASPQRARV
jgi:hypothetical protein